MYLFLILAPLTPGMIFSRFQILLLFALVHTGNGFVSHCGPASYLTTAEPHCYSQTKPLLLMSSQPPETKFPDVDRPDPSSLIVAQDPDLQRAAVIAIGGGIVGGTYLLVNFLSFLGTILPFGLLDTIVDFTAPIPLGLLYILFGVTHFIYKDGYAAIVPPNGTWGGLWDIPAPGASKLGLSNEEFHVLWTGLAEIGGGILLILGALNALPIQIPAFLLFVLTMAVYPANVYMFTHDAQMSFAPPIEYPLGHLVRGIAQCILLSILWFLTFH